MIAVWRFIVKSVNHFISVLHVEFLFYCRCHQDVLNVCIFESVFCITDMTCGLRWPYSKRMLGLHAVFLLSSSSSLLLSCSTVHFKMWAPSFYANIHNHLCIFLFLFFLHAFGKKINKWNAGVDLTHCVLHCLYLHFICGEILRSNKV